MHYKMEEYPKLNSFFSTPLLFYFFPSLSILDFRLSLPTFLPLHDWKMQLKKSPYVSKVQKHTKTKLHLTFKS